MSPIKTATLAAALSVLGRISQVSAHGFVQGIVIGGEYYPGFNPGAAPFQHPPPAVIGWPNGATDTGFVSPHAFGSSDIVCHLNSSPGEKHAKVAAGSSIDLQWNQWPTSHHGPIIDYMAKCDGECEKADKNALKFFKIDEAGLLNGSPAPGTWATENLIAKNLTWTVTIPASIAPGNYVLRHEIIALHSADKPDGAQAYPQCINLEVTGAGTEAPTGIAATEFYTPTDPGIFLSIYYPALQNYTIPGPPLFSGASTGANMPPSALPSTMPVSSAVVVVPDSTTAAPEAPTSALAPMEPSTTPMPVYPGASTTTEECTTTTTTVTTITLTTTITPGITPTDVALIPASEVAAVPASTTSAYPEAYPSPPAPEKYMPDPSPTSSEPATSPSPVAFSPSEVPSPVGSATAPTASAEAGGSDTGLPGGMSLQEFIEWLKEFMTQYFKSDEGGRKHARDLGVYE